MRNCKHLISFCLYIVFIPILFLNAFIVEAQSFTLELKIKNQPSGQIILGSIKGDDFIRFDSISVMGPDATVKFNFPDNAHPGVYRVILGYTNYARIMNEAPQQIDFIFDNENIVIETDFKEPVEKLKVITSKENAAWFNFRKKDRELMEKLSEAEIKLNECWEKKDTVKLNDLANQYNQMLMERDMFVQKSMQDCRGLFVSQIIRNQRLPVLDGYLSPQERLKTYKNDFFKVLDFSNPELINTQVYTDNIFSFLMKYNDPLMTQKQREAEYTKAVDIIMANIRQNPEVQKFITGYLLHGFEVLKMTNLVAYINRKYVP
jgi:hypothetical protein